MPGSMRRRIWSRAPNLNLAPFLLPLACRLSVGDTPVFGRRIGPPSGRKRSTIKGPMLCLLMVASISPTSRPRHYFFFFFIYLFLYAKMTKLFKIIDGKRRPYLYFQLITNS